VYYVTELASPNAQVKNAANQWVPVTVTPAQPFIVTVPITADNNSWDYSVDVYPKNGATGIPTKTVDMGDATKLGDTVTYTIRGDISGTPTDVNKDGEIDTQPLTTEPVDAIEAAYIDGFKFVDPLDARLGYDNDNAPLTVQIGTVNGTTGVFAETQELQEGIDYTVAEDLGSELYPDDQDVADTNYITVLFKQPGLDKLMAHNGEKVQITLEAKVLRLDTSSAPGIIENRVTQYPNQASFTDPSKTVTSPEGTAIVKFGDYTVLKKDADGAPLENAVFEVYTALLDDGSGMVDPDSQVIIDGKSQWNSNEESLFNNVTSDAAGFTIKGLRYSNYYNGGEVNPGDTGYIQYYLVEVQAPEGYALQAAPIPFAVDDSTSTAYLDLSGTTPRPDWTVVNVKNNGGFMLPMTGAGGTALIVGGGVLVAALGLLLALRIRNRSRQPELAS